MKTRILVVALTMLCGSVSSQAPVRQWVSFFNGNMMGKDESRSVIAAPDGSVLVTGTSYHLVSGGNFSTIKYDSLGTQLWADHTYSAQQGYLNGGKKLVQDKWGNFYAVGTLAINDGDLAIIKYGPNGKLWSQNYEPYYNASYNDIGMDIGTDTSGNFVAIAQVMSIGGNLEDLYIMKCDSSGTRIWDENYSAASGPDYPRSLAVSPSGNSFTILSAFNFFGTATYDLATKKYTAAGNPDWTTNYNGAGNAEDFPSMIDIDASESTYVCGVADAGANNDMVCYKQNLYGTRLWTVHYSGTANENDTAVVIRRLPNNLVAVTGSARELVNGVIRNGIVTMLIDSGTVLWTKKYYGTDSLGATPTGMIVDDSGNLVICGFEESSMMFRNGTVVCYDPSGTILWSDNYDSGSGLNDRFNAITKDNYGNILVTGQSFSSGVSNSNYVTIKYGYGIPQAVSEQQEIAALIYPNPIAQGHTTIIQSGLIDEETRVSIYSIDGRKLFVETYTSGKEIQLLTHQLRAGIYTIVLENPVSTKPVKLIIQ